MAERIASSRYSPVSFDVPDERVLDAMVLAIAFRALESMTQCLHDIQKGRPALVAKAAAMERFGVAMSDIFPSSPEAPWTVLLDFANARGLQLCAVDGRPA